VEGGLEAGVDFFLLTRKILNAFREKQSDVRVLTVFENAQK
jgi:hypothetical protein